MTTTHPQQFDQNISISKTLIIIGPNSIHTKRFINGISPYVHKIIFITNHNNITSERLQQNISTHYLSFKLTSISTPFKIAKILQQHNNCIVHIHQANSYAFHAIIGIKLAKIQCKTILTTWGSDILLLPQRGLLFKHMVKYNLSSVDYITAGSLYMSSQIRLLVPDAPLILMINFGVQHFPPRLDISKKENIILSNRLHKPLYNIDKIILAFAGLLTNPKYMDYTLVIAATGSQTNKLTQLVHDMNIQKSVKFIGMVDYATLQQWYTKAKLFVSIPSSDSASLSTLEAMSFGCYPILSNLPANVEYLIDGINGTICQNLNSLHVDMIKALEIIANPCEYAKIAQFNYDLVSKKAVFNNNIKQFLALY